jgi:protein O-GlcNAc transferase
MSEDLNKLQNAYKLHQQGRLVEAASIYEQLIRRDSKNYDALHFLGTIKASLGEFVEAQKLLERSLGSKKNKIAYVENYASILFLSRDYERAVQICTKTIKENDNTETIQYVLAISLYKQNRLDEAIKQFGLLLSLYPNHLAGNNEKASVLAELERYDEESTNDQSEICGSIFE